MLREQCYGGKRTQIILGLYKYNYSLAVKEMKLHSALWRQPQGWYGPPNENEFNTPALRYGCHSYKPSTLFHVYTPSTEPNKKYFTNNWINENGARIWINVSLALKFTPILSTIYQLASILATKNCGLFLKFRKFQVILMATREAHHCPKWHCLPN